MWQSLDKFIGINIFCGCYALLVRCIKSAVFYILHNSSLKYERILHKHSDFLSK